SRLRSPMKNQWLLFALFLTFQPASIGQQPKQKGGRVVPAPSSVTIGEEPVVILKRPQSINQAKPQFLTATVLPGRGMAILQITAYVPGKGEVEVFTAPSLGDAKDLLDNHDDNFGNKVFTIGGAFLVPYANRIRGKVSSDGNDITTTVAGQTVHLPANWSGKNPGAEKHSMHGLMLTSKFENVRQHSTPQASTVSGIFHAGDWNGHWPSSTDMSVRV